MRTVFNVALRGEIQPLGEKLNAENWRKIAENITLIPGEKILPEAEHRVAVEEASQRGATDVQEVDGDVGRSGVGPGTVPNICLHIFVIFNYL
jgi:hypothetical protein